MIQTKSSESNTGNHIMRAEKPNPKVITKIMYSTKITKFNMVKKHIN